MAMYRVACALDYTQYGVMHPSIGAAYSSMGLGGVLVEEEIAMQRMVGLV